MKNKKTKALAFSGLSVALIVVLLFVASIVDVLDYSASAICGLIVTFILIEFGIKNAVSVYFASSIIAFLLIPSKISAILFIVFCGWYSFVKRYLERLKKPLEIVSKFLLFNLVLAVIIAITRLVLLIDNIGIITIASIALVSNFAFLLYDILITKLIWLYVNVYRKKLKFLR